MLSFQPVTKSAYTVSGEPLRIHLLSTGAVSVKRRFRDARFSGIPAAIDFLIDRKFTEWMPVWVMVIEHPEGVFLVDTGENARVTAPDYFSPAGRWGQWFNQSQFKFKVAREEEIDRQLESIGLSTSAINRIVLTHLHLDHVDGLHHFPGTPVMVNRDEWKRPYGDLPFLYPAGFTPELIGLEESHEYFPRVYYLTKARDLLLIETPGHTWHHCSLLLQTASCGIFFAADMVYNQDQLATQRFSGACASQRLAAKSYEWVKEYARSHQIVILPSHEAAAAGRLLQLQPFSIPHRQ